VRRHHREQPRQRLLSHLHTRTLHHPSNSVLSPNHGIYLASGTSGVTVSGNEASFNARGGTQRAANGVDVVGPNNAVIGNVLHDNEDSGLQFYPGANNGLAVNNVSYNNGDHGIDNLNVVGGTIIGNTVYHNCTSGINVEGSSTSDYVVENNVAVDNAVYPAYNGISCSRRTGNIGVYDNAPATTIADYNLVWLTKPGNMYVWAGKAYNTLPALQAASGQEAHGLFADPQFVSPSNWNLQLLEGSPAIDAANSDVSGQLPTDVIGNPRVDDPLVTDTGAGTRTYDDRGAYEYRPSLPTTTTASTTTTTAPASTTTSTTTTSTTTMPSTTTTIPGRTNLVANPGFETDLTGWKAYGSGSLQRAPGGHSGSWAAEADNPAAASASCGLNDSPNWIATTQAGTYTVSVWVRGDVANSVKLNVREYASGTNVGSKTVSVMVSPTWQLVSLIYTIVSPGSTLDLNTYSSSAAPGQCFQADDVSETLN